MLRTHTCTCTVNVHVDFTQLCPCLKSVSRDLHVSGERKREPQALASTRVRLTRCMWTIPRCATLVAKPRRPGMPQLSVSPVSRTNSRS